MTPMSINADQSPSFMFLILNTFVPVNQVQVYPGSSTPV